MGEVKQNHNPGFAFRGGRWFGTFIVGRNQRGAEVDELPDTFHWACPYLEIGSFQSLLVRASYLDGIGLGVLVWFQELTERHPECTPWARRLLDTQREALFDVAVAMGRALREGRCCLPGAPGVAGDP